MYPIEGATAQSQGHPGEHMAKGAQVTAADATLGMEGFSGRASRRAQ